MPDRANTAASRRKNKVQCKIERYPDLKKYILDRLIDDKWSPEIIAGRMKHEKKEHLISHETIYKYIYSYDGQKLKLYESLMYARPKRQLKFSRRKRVVPDIYKIHNRPDHINARQEFGHFEGDLTFFKGSRNGNLSVVVERLSRKAFIVKNDNKRSVSVMLNLWKMKNKIPSNFMKSITFDNGGEFAQFGLLTMTGTHVFF